MTRHSSKLRVGLVQIAELSWVTLSKEEFYVRNSRLILKPGGERKPPSYVYFPYTIGLLQAYVERHAPDQYDFLLPVFRRIPVASAVEQLRDADVIGFSVYVWNIRLSLLIARRLKEIRPDAVIVFGGPQVPDDAEEFLREHDFIDIAVHGEGEPVFLEILKAAEGRDWSEIPSVTYLQDGRCVRHPRRARMRDLDEFPSPYTEGVFDRLMAENPTLGWMAIWETNRGCPFSCTYCDWGSAIAAKVNRFGMERLQAEIDWFAKNDIQHLFVADANFGIFARDVDISRYMVAAYERENTHMRLSIQSAKNVAERNYEIHQIFSRSTATFFGATLSLQSLNGETLEAVRRSNISLDVFRDLQQLYRSEGIVTYTDMIVGMPGETYDSFADGISTLIREGQRDRVAFYNCSVLPNAEMGSERYQQQWGIHCTSMPIIHVYESLDSHDREEATEYLETIIETRDLPFTDWVRTRVLINTLDLFYYDRLLQLPLLVWSERKSIPMRVLIEAFMEAASEKFPLLAEIQQIFEWKARDMAAGNSEYMAARDYLAIWWPVDQYVFIKLVVEERIDELYAESRALLMSVLDIDDGTDDEDLLADTLALNKVLLRLPMKLHDEIYEARHNLLEYYESVLVCDPIPLVRQPHPYRVECSESVFLDWQNWAVDLISRLYARERFWYRHSPHDGPTAAPLPQDRAVSTP